MEKDTDISTEHFVAAALALMHEQGYHKLSLEAVAAAANEDPEVLRARIPTREELARRVIALHEDRLTAAFEETLAQGNPRQRLSLYLDSLAAEAGRLVRYGCPLTRLFVDLKQEGPALAQPATALFQKRLDWITEQFHMMGMVDEAEDFAVRLTGALYGVTLLASASAEEKFLRSQLIQLKSWIRSM